MDAASVSCPVSPGQLDPGFGNSGELSVIFGSGSNSQAEGVVLQPDGKLVMVGTYTSATDAFGGMFIARYTQTGVLDPSFGAGAGYVTDSTMNGGTAVALLPSGDFLVAGYQKKAMGMLVQRYSATGLRDATFGSGGTSVVSFYVGPPWVSRLLVQDGGSIIVYGTAGMGDTYWTALARLDATGALDPTFGTGGTTMLQFLGLSAATSSGLAIDEASRFVGSATVDNPAALDPAPHHVVFRVSADGTLDTGFGSGVVVDLGSGQAGGLALARDGSIVAAGTKDDHFAITRLDPAGAFDTSFGTSGWTSLFDTQSYATDVNVASDGTILAVGRGGLGMAWARVTPAGVPDPVFGNGGTNSVDLGRATALAVGPGCFAVAVGDSSSTMTSISATIVRFGVGGMPLGPGTQGTAGTSGSGGVSGGAGTIGTAGTSGSGGVSGGAGTIGTAGTMGRGGVSGGAGASGGSAAGPGSGGTGLGSGAGSGGTGTASLDPNNLISDFEDPLAVVTMSGVPPRNGYWYAYNDGSATCVQQDFNAAGYPTEVPPTFDGNPNNTRALHAVWSGCSTWGAGVGSEVNDPVVDGGGYFGPKIPYDLTGYTGITFWAMSSPTADNKLRVKLPMTDDTKIADGGNCDEADPTIGANKCSDDWGTVFSLPTNGTWQQIVVYFSDATRFRQEGWGHTFPWNPAHVTSIQFQSQGAETGQSYDFWIDDIYLFK